MESNLALHKVMLLCDSSHMRSLLFALCVAAGLSACAGPRVVPLNSLPDWHGDLHSLSLLTPSPALPTDAAHKAVAGSTREVGRIPQEVDASGMQPLPVSLVEGWVATQKPDRPVGPDSTLRISQLSSGKSDTLKIHGSRYSDDPVMTFLKVTFGGAHARVREAYVLNTRYFGLQLSDERFVLFDRRSGAFVDSAVDMRGVDDIVYVDKEGQPYLSELTDNGTATALKELKFPELSLKAPLSPLEVFKNPAP